MPLHGKVVVIKRSGGDGTEFPLTATCLFGRKPDCDIRIQLPQVSKEHCRIDLNENKEVVLTNLSSVNQTRVNGEVLQQSERLKHGDVITIIDRSFRFEYPPAPTPKKRSSVGGKTDTLKIRQDQQVADTVTVETREKKNSEVFTAGNNNDNIQRALEKTVEVESKEDGGLLQEKTASPFSDLYQMIKKSLDVKTPRKSSACLLQTPTSRLCTPLPASVRKNDGKAAIPTEDQSTPKKDEAEVFPGPAADTTESGATSPQKRTRVTPQRFTVCEASAQRPKSPMRRKSKEDTPAKHAVSEEQETVATAEPLRRTSPRNAGKAEKAKEMSKKRKSGELADDLPTQKMKRKRVSFGLNLSPELFDKRLPPDSPLRKGAAPRRSLGLYKPKQSLIRRASAIGSLTEFEEVQSPAKKRTPSPKKSPSTKSASPKTPTPAKKSPKSRSPSPKAASPGKKSPKTLPPTTPTVQGRFSVSRVSTPSPTAEDVVPDQMPFVTVTPKIPQRRKSMNSAARRTPSVAKSAAKIMRRSGFSRASMKVKNSWAEVVKFGQTKAQVSALAKKAAPKKITVKKAVSKPQTPARNPCCHVSTGHADSPVTIVVGRAHKRNVLPPTGAAPRVVTNTALTRRNMKMDEDLTGISVMFKTPVNERKGRSAACNGATETPMGVLGTSVVEPSLLNTPEGPGEMIVSPLNVASAVVGSSYSSEAVQRLLNEDQDGSFVSEIPPSEVQSNESNEEQSAAVKKTPVKTPKQKPEQPLCLTGVKRIMKTPKQKAEPIEDLRGKILKTPKQKPEQRECLTGVKRIMKTPRQKAEPVEDIRGNLLVTPKQKREQQECLTGVKKIFQTPQQEAESAQLPELVEETDPSARLEPDEADDQTPACGVDTAKELDFAHEEPQENSPAVIDTVPQVDIAKEADAEEVVTIQTEDVPNEHTNDESSDIMETTSQTAVDESSPEEEPKVEAVVDSSPEEEPMVEAVVDSSPEEEPMVEAVVDSSPEEEPKVEAVVDSSPEEEPMVEAVVDSSPEEEPKVEAVVDCSPEEEPKVEAVVDSSPEEEPKVEAVVERSPEEEPKVEAVVDSSPEEEPKVEAVVDSSPEEEPKVEAVVDSSPEEEPKVEAVVERSPEEEPKVEAVVDSSPEEEPKVEAVVDSSPEEEPKVEAVVDSSPEEEPKVEAVVDSSPEEEPKVEAVVDSSPEEEPKVEAVVESSPEEEPKVEAVVESSPEEEPKVEAVVESSPKEEEAVVESSPEEVPKLEAVVETTAVTEMDTTAVDPVQEKKSVRGRRAKAMVYEAAEHSEEPAAPTPVRGRRGKKAETTAPSTVGQTTRTRNARTTEHGDADLAAKENAPPLPKVAVKPKRGRSAKKALDDQAEMVQEVVAESEMVPEEESEPIPPVDVDRKASDSAATQIVPPAAVTESLPEADAETCQVTDTDEVIAPKKTVRGRRGKLLENKQEAEDLAEEPVAPAPVRGRRGKKAEATATTAVRLTTRTRKTQGIASDDKPETVPEKSLETEDVSDQTPLINTIQEENDSASPAEEAVKPVRGRRTKQALVEPPQPEEGSDEPITIAVKPKRGRKTKLETAEQKEIAEDAVVVETEQQSQPPVRAKRGRNTKREEEKQENDGEAPKAQEPAKKVRRTRKTEEEHVKPSKEEEIRTDEMVVPVEAEASPVAEPLEVNEPVTVTTKPKRGGRKAKQSTESETPVESTEVQEAPAVKPKRGRRVKAVAEEVEVTAEGPGEKPAPELEAEEETSVEPDTPVVKPTRARGVKTVKDEVPQVVPVKRTRRGAAPSLEDASAESTVLVSSSVPTSVEPAKRGRRPAAKPTTEEPTVSGDQSNTSDDLSSAAVEDVKVAKRSVRRKADTEVVQVPVKAVRGRKSKLVEQVDANQTEEKDLSEEVVEAQPIKRARRGAKVAEETESLSTVDPKKDADAETQPKTRKGRSAKK